MLRKHTRQSIEYKVKAFRSLSNRIRQRKLKNEDVETTGMEIFDKLSRFYVAANDKYILVPYNGEIVLFYATDHYVFLDRKNNIKFKKIHLDEKTKNRWKDYATSIVKYEIQGDHSDIFNTDHGVAFAQTLQMYLDNP